MELGDYLGALRKGWWLAALGALIGVGLSTGAFLLTTPKYASTVDFYVSTPIPEGANAQQAGQFAQQRVNSYVALMTSERLATLVVQTTGVDLDPVAVTREISAEAKLNTVIVTATVTDTDPQRSLTIARGLASQFPTMVDQLDNQGTGDDTVNIQVVSSPALQVDPVAPSKRVYLALGLGAGTLAGLVLIIGRHLFDTSLRTVEDTERIAKVPVLGTVNFDVAARKSPLIVGDQAKTVRAETYRQLRTNLRFVDVAGEAHVAVVSSPLPSDGKSTVAANLALSYVEFGYRTCLVEADLRRPSLFRYLGVDGSVGLTNVLAGQFALDEVVQEWGGTELRFLAGGPIPPNPSELLGSEQMAAVVADLRSRFDKVVIDTPPLLPVTDAAVLAGLADGVVLVVRHGRTTRAQLGTVARSLATVDARVLGVVLNMRKTTQAERRRYGSHRYYGTSPKAVATDAPTTPAARTAASSNLDPAPARASTARPAAPTAGPRSEDRPTSDLDSAAQPTAPVHDDRSVRTR